MNTTKPKMWEIAADAAFIVRACNNAQRLADALRDCLINDPKHFTPAMNAALAQWEGDRQ